MLEITIDPTHAYFIQTTVIEKCGYQFEFIWNEREERWRFSLLDMQDKIILKNLKITPWLPLTLRYKIQGIFKGDLIGIDTKTNFNLPTRNNLGTDFKLYYFTKSELKSFSLDKLL